MSYQEMPGFLAISNDKLSSNGAIGIRGELLLSREQALTIVVVLVLNSVLQGIPLSSDSYHNPSGPSSTSPAVSPSSPDFNLTASPRTVYLYRGSSTTSSVEVRSLGGFSGSVLLNVMTDAYSTDGISSSVNQNPLQIPANGSANSTLTVSATESARFANYAVTVYAYGDGFSHNQTVGVQFTWFTIYAPTQYPEIGIGSSKEFPVTIMSVSGFTGLVHLTGISYPSSIGISINPSVLTLAADGSNETVVKLSVPDFFCPCNEGAFVVDLSATGRGVSNVFSMLLITPAAGISLTTAIALVLTAVILIALPTLAYIIRKKAHHSIAPQRKESAGDDESRLLC